MKDRAYLQTDRARRGQGAGAPSPRVSPRGGGAPAPWVRPAAARFALFVWLLLVALSATGTGAEDELLLQLRKAADGRRIRVINLSPATAALIKATPASDGATLRWNNGESLAGEPVEASATELTWRSPFFDEPLVLQWSALRRIDRVLEPATSSEPFSFALRDGSHLFGNVVAVSEATITVRSARHGEVALKRSEVLSARRLTGGSLIAAGPAGESRWRIVADTTKNVTALASQVPLLRTGAAGALELPYWNRGAALDVVLPELVDVEFRVRSTKRPDFQLSLGAGGKHRLRVETWDDELVVTAGRSFKSIRTLVDSDREVALRICWDRKAQKCSVFTVTGEPMVEWEVPPDASNANQQVVLQNKGRDLSLEFLRVRKWDGKAPAKTSGKFPRVEFSDGRTVEGQIGAGADGAISLKTAGQDSGVSHPLSEVDALVFSADLPQKVEVDTTLVFGDGTLLHGGMVAIKDGRVALRTGFSAELLGSQMAGLRQLLRQTKKSDAVAPEPPLTEWDTLVLPKLTLHGKLASTGDARLRWLPVGGVRPALPAKGLESEIRRAPLPIAEPLGALALFYMQSGDVLPGILRSLDRTGVEIDSGVVEVTKLPVETLDAIQFGGGGGRNLRGFGDAGWRIVKGTEPGVRKKEDSLSMDAGTAIGHPSVLQSSEIKFSFNAASFAVIRLRLFCAGTESAQSTNLVMGNMGGRLYSGIESTDGLLDHEQQMTIDQGQSVAVRLSISDKQVELFFNDVLARKIAISPTKRAGAGLVIEPASAWGNTVRAVTLKDFSATSNPGRAWLPEVSVDAKLQALTIPRFRKDDPPRHALLATNGDVLRGEIEAATASHFGFRSGLENLRVPRDRVQAAIWLKKPDKDAPPPATQNTALKLLEQRLTRNIRYSGASLGTLTGVLQREVSGLKFRLPDPIGSVRITMQFGGQTVAEALDQICGQFGLRHRVENDTIILEVLEGAASAAPELREKMYWLRPSAFPFEASAQATLASRGVLFSNESKVIWQPKTGHLTVTNSPANHEKLAAVLAAEFGGVLGSPTHWLLLTSGARLGLAVEKFAPDAVIGSHPAFGRCRIPLDQIHTIRTTPPEATPTMKSLADWRLVDAPEPVLPESGGESSPALGKVAKTFILPLLGGGDFDLAQWKGKVVVLDFWATWCGPCIKSLPALIETMSAFPPERVTLLGVNQSEPAEQVKRFLEARGWKFNVALDAGQKVARQYGVEGIPHTVIVGPDGNVAWVKTGFSPDGAAEVANAVKQLLAGPAATPK